VNKAQYGMMSCERLASRPSNSVIVVHIVMDVLLSVLLHSTVQKLLDGHDSYQIYVLFLNVTIYRTRVCDSRQTAVYVCPPVCDLPIIAGASMSRNAAPSAPAPNTDPGYW